jgi:hypothetical protein
MITHRDGAAITGMHSKHIRVLPLATSTPLALTNPPITTPTTVPSYYPKEEGNGHRSRYLIPLLKKVRALRSTYCNLPLQRLGVYQ